VNKTTIALGERHLKLYLARSPKEWRVGLSACDLSDVDGMFFTFPTDVHLAFHMGGCRQPVLIAFFTASGRLVDVNYMTVGSRPVLPDRPYRYALELIGEHATPAGAFDLLESLVGGIGHVVGT
jgi:uncharacterized membrane protein (UPF0127 family)